ncbi:hypothetical protein OAM64_05005 [Candidatus Thioglobus sp.]|nr:hypothetical protein [Candidatus Thioglobus sp.]MDC0407767.1 hypothetical protein [Candidatus Thioglobus sp.]
MKKKKTEKELSLVKSQLSGFKGVEIIKDYGVLATNHYWIKLMNLAAKVISEYPSWKSDQRKVQKIVDSIVSVRIF